LEGKLVHFVGKGPMGRPVQNNWTLAMHLPQQKQVAFNGTSIQDLHRPENIIIYTIVQITLQ